MWLIGFVLYLGMFLVPQPHAEVYIGAEKEALAAEKRAAKRAGFQEAEQRLREVYAQRFLDAKSRGSREVIAREYASALSELKKQEFNARKEWIADKRETIQSQINELQHLAKELAEQQSQRKSLQERRRSPLQPDENWRKSYRERLHEKRRD